MRRVILHIDMDFFYAAVELRENPSLRGRPVAVGGSAEGRGVLTTCNYEARKFGCHSAMPTYLALRKCPELVLLPPRFALYREVSDQVREIFRRHTSLIEPLSLDEAYLDLGGAGRAGPEVAAEIRAAIRHETGLTASAGVGPNKLLAKIACEWRKPDGEFEITPEMVPEFMAALPVSKLWGVGKVTAEKLSAQGVTTCADLQETSLADLHRKFGKMGLSLYGLCRGIDPREVEPERERKSLSNERTFARDLRDLPECQEHLAPLVEELAAELASKAPERRIRTVFVKIRFADFTRTTVERASRTPDAALLAGLLAEGYGRSDKQVRLLGVGARFAEDEPEERQMTLF